MRIAMGLIAVASLIALATPGAPQESSRATQLRDQGLASAQQKDWNRALDLLNQAQKLAPEDSSIMYSLGTVHESAGEALPAIGWLRAYLQAEPDGRFASKVALEITRLRTELRGDADRIFTHAERAAAEIDQSTPRGAMGFAFAMGDIAHAQVDAGSYGQAYDTAARAKMSPEDRDYFEDHILTSQASVAALKGNFDAAARLLPQIKHLGFAVGGVALYVTGIPPPSGSAYPGPKDYEDHSFGDPHPVFWSHVEREMSELPCWRVDEALAKQAHARVQEDLQELPPYSGWMGNNVSRGPTDRDVVHACARMSAVERWINFAETVCDNGKQCSVTAAAQEAASEGEIGTIASRLSTLGRDIGQKLLDFDVLDARTSGRTGK
jgi:hypothetical protein